MSLSSSAVVDKFNNKPDIGTVLVVGEFTSSDAGRYMADAFRYVGWDVVELDEIKYLSLHAPRSLNRMVDIIAPKLKISRLSDAIVATARRTCTDLVFFCNPNSVNQPLLKALSSHGCLTACWNWSAASPLSKSIMTKLSDVSLVVASSEESRDLLQTVRGNRQTRYIPGPVFCGETHRRLRQMPAGHPAAFDVVIVGSHSADRQAFVEQFALELPDAKLAICGPGWPSLFSSSKQFSIHASTVNGDVSARALNSATIGLVLECTGDTAGAGSMLTAYAAEVPACGTFMLHTDCPEIRNLYDVGNDIDVFTTLSEAVEKVRYYLQQPTKRETMAERAWQRALASMSFAHRGEQVARLAGELLKGSIR